MLNSRFSPVNNQLARRFTFLVLTSASLVSIFLFGAASSIVAQPQALEECVERLARKAVDALFERLRLRNNRSEEHTSELQSHSDLVCRLLLEKKNTKTESTTWRSR